MIKIKDFENYSIDKQGNVYNNKRMTKLKPLHKNGYLYINLYKNGKNKAKRIHRLVAEAFIPNPDNKPQVNHINCNKTCNNIENLEWCTDLENKNHAYKNGISKRILSKKQVVEIKRLSSKGYSNPEISYATGINRRTIYDITNGITWRHI